MTPLNTHRCVFIDDIFFVLENRAEGCKTAAFGNFEKHHREQWNQINRGACVSECPGERIYEQKLTDESKISHPLVAPLCVAANNKRVYAGCHIVASRHWRRHTIKDVDAGWRVGKWKGNCTTARNCMDGTGRDSREAASARAWTSVSEQLVHVVKPRQKSLLRECNLHTNDRFSTRLRRAPIQTVDCPRDHGTSAYQLFLKRLKRPRTRLL